MSRINARFDQEYMDKLEAIKQYEHLSTTQVLKLVIDEYYSSHLAQNNNKLQLLLNSNFIACGNGEENLSSNYKKYLSDDLIKKHDHC